MNKFNPKDFEKKWRDKWEEEGVYQAKEPDRNQIKNEILTETENIFQNIQFKIKLDKVDNLKALVLAVLKNRNGEYLILERSENDDFGMWDLPGGSIESEDLTYEMQKEIKEETGGEAQKLKFVFSYDGYNPEFKKTYRYFIFSGEISHNIKFDSEHSDYKFVSADEAYETLFWEGHKKAVKYIDTIQEKSYVLDMYPYPSGSGLHVGHPRGYLGSDVVARYKRMQGMNVLHPIGFDSFGLPAENYAIKTGIHPEESTNKAIAYFKEQIDGIGLSYDWSREVMSHDPEYMKWTQWLFLQLFNKGLAYQKESPVNWCPKDQTVLANEQVEPDGTCERCGTEVIQKNMKQWFFKITDYADRLIDDLAKIDWPESTKLGQVNWIGRSEGAEVDFKVTSPDSQSSSSSPRGEGNSGRSSELGEVIKIFTTRPETIYCATYMAIAPEHEIISELIDKIENDGEVIEYIEKANGKSELARQQQKDKTGVEIKGVKAVNPVNGKEIPIWIADYVLVGYGTGAIMGVPGNDDRDHAFALKYNLKVIPAMKVPDDSSGLIMKKYIDDTGQYKNSGKILSFGLDRGDVSSIEDKRQESINKYREQVENGEKAYYSEDGIMQNSGNLDTLRAIEAREKILSDFEEKGWGKRVTTYRLRDWLISRQRYWGCPIPIVYDPEGKAHPVKEEHLPMLLPTDVDYKPKGTAPLGSSESYKQKAEELYGKGWHFEIDTMDTFMDSTWYFFRFTDPHNKNEFANSEKMNFWMPVDLYVGGAEHTVLHLMYARFFTKFLFDEGYLDFDEPFQKLRHQGIILAEDSRKMSKRWGNTIDPNTEIEKYGADTLRVYEMFMGPFDSTMPWDTKAEIGVNRFLARVWSLQEKVKEDFKSEEQEREINKTIKKVTEDIEAMSFNTAVAKMMELSNYLIKEESINKSVFERFVLILAPFAPFMTEEMWNALGNDFSIHNHKWPEFNMDMVKDETIEMGVQVNGKMRGTISISPEADEEVAMEAAKQIESINKYLDGGIKKVIYVKGRILNIVV